MPNSERIDDAALMKGEEFVEIDIASIEEAPIEPSKSIHIGRKECPSILIDKNEYYLLEMDGGSQFALKKDPLGGGNYGTVYEGYHYNSQTGGIEKSAKAIKVYHYNSFGAIYQELQIQNHYYPTEFYCDSNLAISVIDKLPGLSMGDPKLIKQLKKLPFEKRLEALISLMQEMAEFHRKRPTKDRRPAREIGLDHPDLKPDNMLLHLKKNELTQEIEFIFYPIDFACKARTHQTRAPECIWGMLMKNSLEMDTYSLTVLVALLLDADEEDLYLQDDLSHFHFNLEKVVRYVKQEGKKRGIETETDEMLKMIQTMCDKDPSQRPTDFMLEKIFWKVRKACARKIRKDGQAIIENGAKVQGRDENGRSALHLAVLTKDKDKIFSLLEELQEQSKSHGKIKCKNDFDGRSPLYCAILMGCSVEIIKKLMSTVSFKSKDYLSCVELAAATCDYEVVDCLLEKLVKIHKKTNKEISKAYLTKKRELLHKAAIAGNTNVIKEILERELVNIDSKSLTQATPFQIALYHGQTAACKLLIENEAISLEDFTKIFSYCGYTLLQCAVMQGDEEVVQYFLEKDKNLLNNTGESRCFRSPVHLAAELGHVAILKGLIKAGAVLNCKDYKGDTPLHYAARRKDNGAVIRALLEEEVEVNAQNEDGHTPLSVAAKFGNTEAVKILLERGADVNWKDEDGITLLHAAIKNGHVDTVCCLLNYPSIDKNAADNRGFTPLHLAAKLGNTEMVCVLLDGGADIDEKNNHEITPLRSAIEHGHVEVVLELLKRGANSDDIQISEYGPLLQTAMMQNNDEALWQLLKINKTLLNWSDENGLTLLHLAIELDDLAKVTFLLKQDADPNGGEEAECRPLQLAIKNRVNFSIVKALLHKGANVNEKYKYKDKNGKTLYEMTLLHSAVESGNLEQVAFLLGQDADPNCVDERGRTPLHWTVRDRNKINLKVVKKLLEKEININAKDHNGMTPLHLSIESGNPKLVSYLLKKGADKNVEDNNGFILLISAAERGNAKILDCLLVDVNINKKYKNGMTLLHFAAESGNVAMMRALIERGADINLKDSCGRTPLHCAAEYGNKKTILILCKKGSDINAKDNEGRTPLRCAAQYRNAEAGIILIKKGADINAKDGEGMTVLHFAVKNNYPKMLSSLLDLGADMKKTDKSRRTPLELAEEKGAQNMVEILKKKEPIKKKECIFDFLSNWCHFFSSNVSRDKSKMSQNTPSHSGIIRRNLTAVRSTVS